MSKENDKTKEGKEVLFYPVHILKEAVMAAIILAAIIIFVRYVPVPMERLADPTDTRYVPRPEWYFLFLFQILKYFPGKLLVVGALIIPAVFILLLILLPFFDRNPAKRPLKRPIAMSAAALVVIAVIVLTIQGAELTVLGFQIEYLSNPKHGRQIFVQENCFSCHIINGKGGTEGPDLSHEGSSGRTADYLFQHFKDPQKFVPDSSMPPVDRPDKDIKDLTAYILTLK